MHVQDIQRIFLLFKITDCYNEYLDASWCIWANESLKKTLTWNYFAITRAEDATLNENDNTHSSKVTLHNALARQPYLNMKIIGYK